MLKNERIKIFWDFIIQTCKHQAHNLLDITVAENKQVWLTGVAMSKDSRIDQKNGTDIEVPR